MRRALLPMVIRCRPLRPRPTRSIRNLYKTITYDVFRDFDPVALLARSNFVLATRAGLHVEKVQDLIAMAKASPGKLTMATYGIGSTSHVTMVSFEEATKTSYLHVPYRGVIPVVNALLTGEVDAAFVTPHIVFELRNAGKLKILGSASLQRMAIVSDVPTFTEQGIEGFTGGNWTGRSRHGGFPMRKRKRLAGELQAIAASPAFLAHVKSLGVDAEYLDAAGFADFLKKENQRWGTLIKRQKHRSAVKSGPEMSQQVLRSETVQSELRPLEAAVHDGLPAGDRFRADCIMR